MSTRAKEAIKTALAMVLVYWIAMSIGWMNPYWAGFAVAMISLSTAGESLRKGVLRVAGTVPACIAALVILAVAPQSRWVFIALLSAWIFAMSYMMNTDTKRAYFWQVSGFVCGIVILAGPSDSEAAFEHAVFRTVETAMGVAVYMLVSVFLWPRTNRGATRSAGVELIESHAAAFERVRASALGKRHADDFDDRYKAHVLKLAALDHALEAEGAERYVIFQQRARWRELIELSTAQIRVLARLHTARVSADDIDLTKTLPNLDAFLAEIAVRLQWARGLFDGVGAAAPQPDPLSLAVDSEALATLTTFERSTVAAARRELLSLEASTRSILACARELTGSALPSSISSVPSSDLAPAVRRKLSVVDIDRLRGAIFAASSVFVGFVIWVFVNPPGHAGWFMLAGSLGLAVAGTQQLKTTAFVAPLLVALPISIAVYVLVLPRLSSFWELGLVIFVAMFCIRYFFTGLAGLCGTIALLQGFVTNQQTYNFASVANSAVFTIIAFGFVFMMSYMVRSARPEKAVLSLVQRFFHAAEKLLAHSRIGGTQPDSWVERYRLAHWRNEVATIPSKVEAWGRAIDAALYPGTKPEHVAALVTSLRVLVLQVEDLLESGSHEETATLAKEVQDDADVWRTAVVGAFAKLSVQPDAHTDQEMWSRFDSWLVGVDRRAAEALAGHQERLAESDAESFYRFLGGFRRVSDAIRAYALAASAVGWSEWREERFS